MLGKVHVLSVVCFIYHEKKCKYLWRYFEININSANIERYKCLKHFEIWKQM